jgi:hypothetical protein
MDPFLSCAVWKMIDEVHCLPQQLQQMFDDVFFVCHSNCNTFSSLRVFPQAGYQHHYQSFVEIEIPAMDNDGNFFEHLDNAELLDGFGPNRASDQDNDNDEAPAVIRCNERNCVAGPFLTKKLLWAHRRASHQQSTTVEIDGGEPQCVQCSKSLSLTSFLL